MHRGLLLLLLLHSVQKAEPPALHWEHAGSGPAAEEGTYMNASALPKHAKKVPAQRIKEVKTAGLENMNSLAQVSCINLKKTPSTTWERTNNIARNKFLFQSNVTLPFSPESMKFQSNHAVHVQSPL